MVIGGSPVDPVTAMRQRQLGDDKSNLYLGLSYSKPTESVYPPGGSPISQIHSQDEHF